MNGPYLQFAESFFEGEEIDGFYVESRMKRAWASELEVLYQIDRICKKYNIKYFADSGTLLGAVRHHGFIPWDDDIDIALMREDYNRLFAVLPNELPENYMIWHPLFEKNIGEPHARVFNSNAYTTNENYLKRFHGCPYITGVDIFPLDYVPEDAESASLQKELVKVLTLLIETDKEDSQYEQQLSDVEDLLGVSFNRKEDLTKQILFVAENLITMYRDDESNAVTVYSFYAHNQCPAYDKEWFSEVLYMPFENMMLPVPKEYDKILTLLYGDYMIPVRGVASHDYPFYKEQQEAADKYMREHNVEEVSIDNVLIKEVHKDESVEKDMEQSDNG